MTISSISHALGESIKDTYKKAKHTVSSTYQALGKDVGIVYKDIKGGVSGAGQIMNNAVDTTGKSIKSIGNNVEGISGNLQLPLIAGVGLAALFMLNQ